MTTLLSTTFTGTDGAAWPAPFTTSSGTAVLASNRGQQTTPTGAYTACETRANLTTPTGRVDTTFRIPAVPSVSMRVNVRYNPATGNGYRIIVPTDYAGFQLVKVTAYTESPLCEEFISTTAANTDYRIAVEFTGTLIRAKRWLASNSEPTTWNLAAVDATYTTGDISFATLNGAAGGALTGLWDTATVVDTAVGLPAGRVGFHNDAFLATFNDLGTYSTFTDITDTATRTYTAAQTLTGAVIGGESAEVNSPHTLGPDAKAELETMHWSFLNPAYHAGVIASWTTGEVDEMTRRLGYRLRLTTATLPTTASAGGSVAVAFTIANDGYARARTRAAQVVFVNGGTVITRTLTADIATIAPAASLAVSETVTAPTAGSWTMHLLFPDPDAGLAANPAYSIQLANTGLWDSATGRNTLGHTITVS